MDTHHPGAYPASLILSTTDHTLFTLTNILAANQYLPCLSHTTLTTRTALAFGVRGWDQLTIFVKWLGLQLRGTLLQGEPMKGNFHKNLSRPSPPIALSWTPLVLVLDGDDWSKLLGP